MCGACADAGQECEQERGDPGHTPRWPQHSGIDLDKTGVDVEDMTGNAEPGRDEAETRRVGAGRRRESEKAKGIKRVDVLTNSVIYFGLSLGDRPNEYKLHLRSR